MRIVLEHAGTAHDVVVDVTAADATVADLAATVDRDLPRAGAAGGGSSGPSTAAAGAVAGVVSGTVAGVDVDGRRFGPDTELAELGLCDGTVLRLLGDPPSSPVGGPPSDPPAGPLPPAGTSHPGAGGTRGHGDGGDGDVLALVAVGGPAAGRVWPLRPAVPGAHRGPLRLLIGRAAGCDAVLDDPFVSARHAELHADALGGVTIVDLGSSNGTWLDDEQVTQPARVGPDTLVQIGASQLRARRVTRADRPVGLGVRPTAGPAPPSGTRPGTPPARRPARGRRLPGASVLFNRPPRPAPPAGAAALTPPPAPPDRSAARRSLGVATFVGPLVMAGAMVMLYGNPRFALFALISPLTAIVAALSAWRRRRRPRRRVSRAHRAALRRFGEQLAAASREETRRREERLPDLPEVLRRATLPSVRLWERRPHHDDWLRLRAGLGPVRWAPPLEREGRGGEPAPEARALVDHHAELWSAPVEVDLSPGNTVGIVGEPGTVRDLARALLCQAAVHHGPADLRVVVLCRGDVAPSWDWAKWLPHVRDATGDALWVSRTPETSEALLDGLLAAAEQEEGRAGGLVSLRSRRPAAGGGGAAAGVGRDDLGGPATLYVIDDVDLVTGPRSPARRLLRGAAGPAAGIVTAATEDQLPALCTTVIRAGGRPGDAELRCPASGVRVDGLVVAGLDGELARDCARHLARYTDPELEAAGAGLPATVRLLDLLDLAAPGAPGAPGARSGLGAGGASADRVLETWRRNATDPRPRTPLGVADAGPVAVDLVEDGPHGLVGGTTGSGKSELLRSLVVGMASQVSPEHVTFVLVDYKGGSAFDACARLPHVVGLVTDLDAHLGERALVSLEAELTHREQVLRQAGASDLPAYLAAGAPRGPLPRLVVVVDEFATLAADLPDFLGALVGIAQRGRSLGVHLVLATQRPQGTVNANIKANTNLRIGLRVQDAGDSQDIIDRGDAAGIPRTRPGRAYVRRGHGDVVAVQTALATGAPPSGAAVTLAPFRFAPRTEGPAGDGAAAKGGAAKGRAGEGGAGDDPAAGGPSTDLDGLVAAIGGAFAASGLDSPRRPWLPMLPERLGLDRVRERAGQHPVPGVVAFALADDPHHQDHVPAGWSPAEGHLLVAGMVGSGTTTALRSVARALAETFPVDECHIHAVDFGAGGLADLAALPHAGAVLGARDREAQTRLVRYLRRELDRRRQLGPAELGGEPLIATVVDGIGAFLAEFDGLEGTEVTEAFRRVWSEGPAVGLVCAVSGDRTGTLPLRMASSVSQRILLRPADPAELSAVGYRAQKLPAFVPGRGVHAVSRLVVQVADPGRLSEVAPRLPATAASRPPWRVQTLPAEVRADALPAAALDAGLQVPVAVAEDDLSPVALDLFDKDHAILAGPPRSGRTSALRLIAAQLRAADPGTVLVGVCTERSALHGDTALDAAGTAQELERVLRIGVTDRRRWVVLVDDAGQVTDDRGVLARLLACGRSQLHVVASGRTEDFRSLSHWSRGARRSRHGVLLQPDLATDGDVLSVRLPRRIPVELRPGRGFVVVGGTARLAQLALPARAAGAPVAAEVAGTTGAPGLAERPGATGAATAAPAAEGPGAAGAAGAGDEGDAGDAGDAGDGAHRAEAAVRCRAVAVAGALGLVGAVGAQVTGR